MLGRELLELGDDKRVLALRQAHVDALFHGGEAQLLQPRDLCLRERLVGDVGQRRSAPQRERVIEPPTRDHGVAGRV
jgi:hypothetical protein